MTIAEEMMRWVAGAVQPLRELAGPQGGPAGFLTQGEEGADITMVPEPVRPESDPPTATMAYLRSQMNADGGFRGRGRGSDLYYTVFGLQSLLGLEAQVPQHRVREYLECFGVGEDLDLVHLCCLVRAWWLESCLVSASRAAPSVGVSTGAHAPGYFPLSEGTREVMLRQVEDFRTPDGGYALQRGLPTSSLYAAFLAMAAYQDFGHPMPQPLAVMESVLRLQQPEGGFSNDSGIPVASTAATAAGITLLRHLGQHVPPEAAHWMLTQACPHGGFYAFAGAPECDLLSTAVALHAVHEATLPRSLQAELNVRLEALAEMNLRFVSRMWRPSGGFRGSSDDDTTDVEYTFYGLLALGHLA